MLKNTLQPTLYSYIECAFGKLDNAAVLSKQFQKYSQEAYGGAMPSVAQGKRAQRKLRRKWRTMHDALDKALASVVACIDPPVLQSFDNEHIVLVFYSVVANCVVDEACTGTRERYWPKLDGDDKVTLQAYKLSRSIEKSLVQNATSACTECLDAVQKQLRPRTNPDRSLVHCQQRCSRRVRMQSDSVACTSNGYFADGCRVRAVSSSSPSSSSICS